MSKYTIILAFSPIICLLAFIIGWNIGKYVHKQIQKELNESLESLSEVIEINNETLVQGDVLVWNGDKWTNKQIGRN